MKKMLFSMILMGLMVPAIAQQYNTPTVFHNQWEQLQYQWAHPEQLAMMQDRSLNANGFTQKLDSVVGSDDFDRTRWKNTYTYSETGKVETSYQWENESWQPTFLTETTREEDHDLVMISRWRNEAWELYQRVRYQYRITESGRLLEEVIADAPENTEWVGVSYTVNEYDDQDRLVVNTYYNGLNGVGDWRPYSKTERTYNEEGQLASRLLYNSRNGSWRETQKDTLFYDEHQRCVEMLTYRKGGWGPGANAWRESEKYEFAYTDEGKVASEILYSAGWFGTEMSLTNKVDYTYDAQGNVAMKTVSVFNEVDWVVRDVFENTFDASVNANEVLGLAERWTAMLDSGLRSALEQEMPLCSGWRNCSVAASNLDTQFTLYCSGFEAVGEQQQAPLKAYAEQGCLLVETPNPVTVFVYDLTGRVVASQPMTTSCSFRLSPGLYLVKGGNQVTKVIVR